MKTLIGVAASVAACGFAYQTYIENDMAAGWRSRLFDKRMEDAQKPSHDTKMAIYNAERALDEASANRTRYLVGTVLFGGAAYWLLRGRS